MQSWKPHETEDAQFRLRVLSGVIGLLFLALLARFWYLQIAQGEHFQRLSEENRTARIELPAPRGIIRDQHGVILASTRPAFTVSIMPAEVVDLSALLDRLSEILGRPVAELREEYDHNRIGRFKPVPLLRNAPLGVVTRLEEEQSYLPGVLVESEPVRTYPNGIFASHLLGYVREVSREEIQRLNDPQYRGNLADHLGVQITREEMDRLASADYRPRDIVGKTGVERFADLFVRGTLGQQRVQRDARGNLLQILGTEAPEPGNTLILSLDARVQRAAEMALQDMGKSGAAVALDPRTGDVLALASVPAYDPTWFAHGMSRADYRKHIGDNPRKPLLNRAINSAYPPGSTFKIATATAILQKGAASTRSYVYCTGSMRVGNMRKRCWATHGSVEIYKALAKSCDVFFYTYSKRLSERSPDPMADWAERFGFGRRTGIPLESESAGRVPRLEWHRRREKRDWYPGDTANMSIGQGGVTATPLQVAQMTSALANGGTLYQPRVVRSVLDLKGRVVATFPPKVTGQVPFDPKVLEIVRKGIRQAVTAGTAGHLKMKEVEVAGKTGSAESGRHTEAHAWFTCYAPYKNPTIAIAVLTEHGGHGATAAAPVARRMIRAYFGLKPDAEPDATSTPGD